MSQYVEIYMRADEKLIKLHSRSRSSYLYEALYSNAAYGKLLPLTKVILDCAKESLNRSRTTFVSHKVEYEKKINYVENFKDASVDERLEKIEELMSSVNAIQEEIDEVDATLIVLDFLEEILYEAKDDYFSLAPESAKNGNILYYGIEVEDFSF